jgi:hypothetical protein
MPNVCTPSSILLYDDIKLRTIRASASPSGLGIDAYCPFLLTDIPREATKVGSTMWKKK